MALIDHVNLKALLKAYHDEGIEFTPNDLEQEVGEALAILGARRRHLLMSRVKSIGDLSHASRNIRALLKNSRKAQLSDTTWYVVEDKRVIRGWTEELYAPEVEDLTDVLACRLVRVVAENKGTTFPLDALLELLPKRIGPTQGACKYVTVAGPDPIKGQMCGVFHEKLKKGILLYSTRDIVENLCLFGKNARVRYIGFEDGLLVWNAHAFTWFRSCTREI